MRSSPPFYVSRNPEGAALFRVLDCRAISMVGGDGTPLAAGAGDPIAQATASTTLRPPQLVVKIVDLDPDQQSITQLYGIVVALAPPGGGGSVAGQMAVAELGDLWSQRFPNPQGDGAASGAWQSDLKNPTWADVQPVLNQNAVICPVMKQSVAPSDYGAVSAADQVLGAITLQIENPAYMPVTRDLSAGHRAMIQTWINNGCPEGGIDA